jgi:hypothetical protein
MAFSKMKSGRVSPILPSPLFDPIFIHLDKKLFERDRSIERGPSNNMENEGCRVVIILMASMALTRSGLNFLEASS